VIRGARENNLKNIDLDLPRQQLVVVTGPSGSGKSSLLYDTLYAEGQRQFLETLSVSSRQFIQQLQRPDVDLIQGLQPTLCIDQRTGSQNPRSTVATLTEIHDHLRVLFARLGTPHCPNCNAPIRQQHAEDILALLLQRPLGTKLMLLAPMVLGQQGAHHELFDEIRKAGYLRARVDGQIMDIEPHPELNPRKPHTIEAIIDRIILRENITDRLTESLRLAIQHGRGSVIVCELSPTQELLKDAQGRDISSWHEQLYSTLYACPGCQLGFTELEPRSFSFNSPYGACPECQGIGLRVEFDPQLVLGASDLSFAKGLCKPWQGQPTKALSKFKSAINSWGEKHTVSWDKPWSQWSAAAQQELWRGTGPEFVGLMNWLEQDFATTMDEDRKSALEALRGEVACPDCVGSRLNPAARAVTVNDTSLAELCAMSIGAAREWFSNWQPSAADAEIATPLVREIKNRLQFMERVGLGYLTLQRAAHTLSGGELQRVRLATSIGSGLVGVCYILDEPSIGLHSHDNERLIESIRNLQLQGNTVLVIEHDEAMMRAADYLVDIGPGAGLHGGQVIAQGPTAQVIQQTGAITADYLSGRRRIEVPQQRRQIAKAPRLTLAGCTANNLQNVTLELPLGVFICVTGVSGSGKSSLINGTLARVLQRTLTGGGPAPGPYKKLTGIEHIQRLLRIDQSSIGRTARSTPATYAGIWDQIRELFAATRESKQRGYKANRFSYNVAGGRCEDCTGLGIRRIEMNFLPDIEVLCETCNGSRFNPATLAVKFKDLDIGQVLQLSIEEAAQVFAAVPTIAPILNCLDQVGLGYLRLGQAGNTLSGGEAQRLKLATELGRANQTRTLFLLDEPTTGLHFEDIRRLLLVLQNLVDQGHTVLVIEHHLDLIKSADYVIDLGPGGGQAGGRIVAQGTPEQVAQVAESLTGRYLKEQLMIK
jgi:excinuclease ABC subunit A